MFEIHGDQIMAFLLQERKQQLPTSRAVPRTHRAPTQMSSFGDGRAATPFVAVRNYGVLGQPAPLDIEHAAVLQSDEAPAGRDHGATDQCQRQHPSPCPYAAAATIAARPMIPSAIKIRPGNISVSIIDSPACG